MPLGRQPQSNQNEYEELVLGIVQAVILPSSITAVSHEHSPKVMSRNCSSYIVALLMEHLVS